MPLNSCPYETGFEYWLTIVSCRELDLAEACLEAWSRSPCLDQVPVDLKALMEALKEF